MNGNIKVASLKEIGMKGYANIRLGSINNRLSDYEIIFERKEQTSQMLQFFRISGDKLEDVQLYTTTKRYE